MAQETLSSTVICEVEDVDISNKKIRLRIHQGKYIAEYICPLDFCPSEARVAGGAFYLDFYSKNVDGRQEYVLRPRAVDSEEEKRRLKEILGPAEKDF